MEFKTKFSIDDDVVFLTERYLKDSTAQIGDVRIIKGKVTNVQTVYYKQWPTPRIMYNIDSRCEVTRKFIEFREVNEDFIAANIQDLIKKVLEKAGENIRIKLEK